jgi:hypothetical protein
MAGFVVRLLGYTLLLQVASRAAQSMWLQDGLESVRRLQHFHDLGTTGLLFAPLVLAVVGSIAPLRSLAVFAAFFLAAAALTAPFVCARVAGL